MIKINEGVNLFFVPTKKFNRIQFTLRFSSRVNPKTAAYRTLLGNLLEQTNVHYQNKKEVSKRLVELDSTQLSVFTSIHGQKHWLNIVVDCIDSEDIVIAAIDLLIDLIFNNKLLNGDVNDEIICAENKRLLNQLETIYDDKDIYSLFCAQRLHYKNSNYMTYTSYGDLNTLKDITQVKLSSYYQKMINEDQVEFLVTGNINPSRIRELCRLFPFKPRAINDDITEVYVSNNNHHVTINQKETQKNVQSKLVMIFNTSTYFVNLNHLDLLVFNSLFGSSPNSRLSNRIREKEGLAYYVFTSIDFFKGLLILQTGISKLNRGFFEAIIFEELESIRRGEFTKEEMDKAKEMIKMQYSLMEDDMASNMENSYFYEKYKYMNWEIGRFNREIDLIPSLAIVEIAKKIVIQTIFFLEGK